MKLVTAAFLSLTLMAGTSSVAHADPWVRNAELNGTFTGRSAAGRCVGFSNCPRPGASQRLSWTFRPLSHGRAGAKLHSNTGHYTVLMKPVTGLGYYKGSMRFRNGVRLTIQLTVTQQVHTLGGWFARKIKGTIINAYHTCCAYHATFTLQHLRRF